MVVPVLRSQHNGNTRREQQAHDDTHGSEGSALGSPIAEQCAEHMAHGCSAEAYPYREGVEGTSIYIVTLAGLTRCGVEVDNKGDAHHHIEQCHDDEVAPVARHLVDDAQQTEQKGQEEVGVA